jgi:hypothetical protein
MAQGGLPQRILAEGGLVKYFLSLRGELSVSQQKLFYIKNIFSQQSLPRPCILAYGRRGFCL